MDGRKDETVIDLRDAPVTIDLEVLGQHDAVLTALANSYERHGHATQQLWVIDAGDGLSAMFDLWVPDFRTVFNVVTIDTIVSLNPRQYQPWRAAGYIVGIAVPEAKASHVERRFAGAVDHLVIWSANGPQISFTENIAAS